MPAAWLNPHGIMAAAAGPVAPRGALCQGVRVLDNLRHPLVELWQGTGAGLLWEHRGDRSPARPGSPETRPALAWG
jgi:hypothetical protein